MRTRTFEQVKEWYSRLSYRDRMLLHVPRMGACCSNPNSEMWKDPEGNWVIKCMNCGAY